MFALTGGARFDLAGSAILGEPAKLERNLLEPNLPAEYCTADSNAETARDVRNLLGKTF